jgi:hypothetical protein
MISPIMLLKLQHSNYEIFLGSSQIVTLKRIYFLCKVDEENQLGSKLFQSVFFNQYLIRAICFIYGKILKISIIMRNWIKESKDYTT